MRGTAHLATAIALEAGPVPLVIPPRLGARVETIGALARVPHAPPVVLGVAEIRGRVVTLLDARVIAGGAPYLGPVTAALMLAPPHAHLGIAIEGPVEGVRVHAGSLDNAVLLDEARLALVLDPAARAAWTRS